MDLPIYTVGSAEFLEMMLNASAMITGSGHAEDLAKIGAILGLVLIAFQAVFNGQAIPFQKVGVMLVLYMVFYGPTTTVTIEDTVTGQVRVVDNVSLGPAFVGSVLSTISYDISKVSEQAFSTPGMTQYGLFSSLTSLTRVRDALRNPLALEQFQTYKASEGHSLPKTLDEYLTFCTLNPVSLRNEQGIDQLYRAGSLAQLMSNVSTSQYVYVYDGSGAQPLKSCAEAKSYLDSTLPDAYEAVLGDILNKGFAEDRAAGRMVDGGDVDGSAEQALQSFSMSGKSAQQYVMTALVMPIFNDSRVKALEHWHEKRAAMALRESLNQQEIQWAGKGDSFKNYMRPMISFFEGLLYAMTPFMAFALMLGRPGLSVLGKYLILPLAVGLWMPLLTIVNAFTIWYAGAQMDSILASYDATGEGFAMLQVLDMDQAITKALGVGGLLAASVPPLALFIVSGSSMVLNSVMGQATSAEKFRSEDVLPRASQPAPVLNTSPMYTGDHVTQGVARTGMRETGPQISAQQAADAVVESSRTAAETQTAQLQQNLQAGFTQMSSTAEGRQTLASLGEQMQSSLGLSTNAVYQQAARKLNSLGISQDMVAQGAYGMSVGASVPYGVAGVRLEDSEQFRNMSSTQQQEAREAMSQLQQAVQASMSEGTVFNAADAFTSNSQAMSQSSSGETVSKSLASARSAQEAYRTAQSQREGWGAGQNLNLGTAAALSIQNSGQSREEAARGMLDMAGRSLDDRDSIRSLMGTATVQGVSSDLHERQIAAATLHMIQTGRMGELVSSEFSPFNFGVEAGNATEHAGLDKPIAGADGLQQRFDSLWGDARDKYRSEVDMASSGYQNTKENGRQIIQDNHNNNTAVVQDSAETHSALVKAAPDQGLEAPKTKLKSATPVTDTGKNLLEINGNNTLVVGAKQVVSGVADAYSTGKESVGEGIERLKEWDREYRARHKLEREQQAGGENQE
ncbi:conjugal transfer protein TraG N-terminal domain-containing protein [Azotobacter beijerinckii]|uniref:Conjugal transfer mating pair stabilization protein TraG n=1 Tax=Azotobacter beijerinckii TaxID=170623 RepID=A0A1I0X528_9GAMM|nr:conjugal transfer protein TraG N-terminal domain-containing protein [Azotobacter beijerinckii]SFA96149.1 conjugal transfer mating pair stabilization protein TraG [Azotobacter beijerinckii]